MSWARWSWSTLARLVLNASARAWLKQNDKPPRRRRPSTARRGSRWSNTSRKSGATAPPQKEAPRENP